MSAELGAIARQAIGHLQAGRQEEALRLLRERAPGSVSLVLLEHGWVDYCQCVLCGADARLGECPVAEEYEVAKAKCGTDAPHSHEDARTGRPEPSPLSAPTQTRKRA